MTPPDLRRTKIIATLGPATDSDTAIDGILEAGANVVRLNASHAGHGFFQRATSRVREACQRTGRTVAVLLDLQGPKVRVGRLVGGGPVTLQPGADLVITTEPMEGTSKRISCTYEGLARDVEEGDTILLDDGLLELIVSSPPRASEIPCRVVVGGELRQSKGINVPGRGLSTPSLSAKDLDDLTAGLALGVDYVALSFVRQGEDVARLRQEIRARGSLVPIVAKIEKPQALEAYDEILAEADAIMVARGDLGVEVPPERVPAIQKDLIARANRSGLPVITATQMLESMIEHPRPTRAEASDVANAIFDGSDAVMLSGETAAGRYPVAAVKMMSRIAREAEGSSFYKPVVGDNEGLFRTRKRSTPAMAKAAKRIAEETGVPLIVVYTLTGTTARVISKLRPSCPIVALCPDELRCRQMALFHGVIPLFMPFAESTDAMVREGEKRVLQTQLASPGDLVVVLGGTMRLAGATNMVQLRELGSAGRDQH